MADIIFAMAALFSDMNCASWLAARKVAPLIRATENSAAHIHQREWGKRYISNPFTNSRAKATTGPTCCDHRRQPSGRLLRLASSFAGAGTRFPPGKENTMTTEETGTHPVRRAVVARLLALVLGGKRRA